VYTAQTPWQCVCIWSRALIHFSSLLTSISSFGNNPKNQLKLQSTVRGKDHLISLIWRSTYSFTIVGVDHRHFGLQRRVEHQSTFSSLFSQLIFSLFAFTIFTFVTLFPSFVHTNCYYQLRHSAFQHVCSTEPALACHPQTQHLRSIRTTNTSTRSTEVQHEQG